jgi:threonine synthase
MRAKSLVPGYTQSGKTVRMHGRCRPAAGEDITYASHNWQAFFLQGTKTLVHELYLDAATMLRRTPLIGAGCVKTAR